MNSYAIRDFEAELNAKTKMSWNSYRQHRQSITRMLLSAKRKYGPKLLVLGAGNCNDIDLTRLVSNGVEIHLADVDVDSVISGIERQGLASDVMASIQEAEMTGLSSLDSPEVATETSVSTAITADQIRPHYSDTFDVVVCTCVFSQMAGALKRAVGADWDYPALQGAMRQRFLDEMQHLTRPGGVLIWISDLVSTDTCPELHTTPTESLRHLLAVCLDTGNFLSGTHPQSVYDDLSDLTDCTPEMQRPWIWTIGDRKYAVYAISVETATL